MKLLWFGLVCMILASLIGFVRIAMGEPIAEIPLLDIQYPHENATSLLLGDMANLLMRHAYAAQMNNDNTSSNADVDTHDVIVCLRAQMNNQPIDNCDGIVVHGAILTNKLIELGNHVPSWFITAVNNYLTARGIMSSIH